MVYSAPTRPWSQEPENEGPDVPKLSVHGRAMKRWVDRNKPNHPRANDIEFIENEAQRALDEGRSDVLIYEPQETLKLIEGSAPGQHNRLRRQHAENILILQKRMIQELGVEDVVRFNVMERSIDALQLPVGTTNPLAGQALTEEQQKQADLLFADWKDNRLEQYKRSPMLVSGLLTSERTASSIQQAWAKGGRPGVERIVRLANAAGDTVTVGMATEYMTLKEQEDLARAEVQASASPHAGDLSNYMQALKYASAKRADILVDPIEYRDEIQLATRRTFAALQRRDPAYNQEIMADGRFVNLSQLADPDYIFSESELREAVKWIRSDSVRERMMEGSGIDPQGQATIAVVAQQSKGARAQGGLALRIAKTAREAGIEVDENAIAELYGMAMSDVVEDADGWLMRAGKGLAAFVFMDVLGSGSRAVAGYMGEGKEYSPRAYVFSDGTVYTNTAAAGLKELELVQQGATDAAHPDALRALDYRRDELGVPETVAEALLPGPFGWAVGAVGDGASSIWDGIFGDEAEEGERFAKPVGVLDLTYETGWGAFDAFRAPFDRTSPYVFDVVLAQSQAGKATEASFFDKAVAVLADVVFDPLNVVGGAAARQPLKQVARTTEKLGREVIVPSASRLDPLPARPGSPAAVRESARDRVAQRLAGVDPEKAKGYGDNFLPDGTVMSPELAGAANVISAYVGGGAAGDEFARTVLAAVIENPQAIGEGLKKVLLQDGVFDRLHRQLHLAGDATYGARAAANRQKAERAVAQVAETNAQKQALREGLDEVAAGERAAAAAADAVADPKKRAEFLREAARQTSREYLDMVLPDIRAVIEGVPGARKGYEFPGKRAANTAELRWADYVERKLYSDGHGFVVRGIGNIPVTAPLQRLESKYGKTRKSLKESEKMAAKGADVALTATEKVASVGAKLALAPFAWAAGFISFTHMRLPLPEEAQGGLLQRLGKRSYGTVKIPKHMVRAYRREHLRHLALVTERVAPTLMLEMSEGLGRALTARERLIATYMWEAEGASSLSRTVPDGSGGQMPYVFTNTINDTLEYLNERWAWVDANGTARGLTDGRDVSAFRPTAKEVETLQPVVARMKVMLNDLFDAELELGLHVERRANYLPHYTSGPIRESQVAGEILQETGPASRADRARRAEHTMLRGTDLPLAERRALGETVEDDLFMIMQRRILAHHEAVSAANLFSQIAENVGIPILRGERALMHMLENAGVIERSSFGMPSVSAQAAQEFGDALDDIGRSAREAQGQRDRLRRVGSLLGLGVRQMADGGSVERMFSSDAFLRLAARRGRSVLDKILPEGLRESFRRYAKTHRDLAAKEKNLRRRAGRAGVSLKASRGNLEERILDLRDQLAKAEVLGDAVPPVRAQLNTEVNYRKSLLAELRYLERESKQLLADSQKLGKAQAERSGRAKGTKFGKKYAKSDAGRARIQKEVERRQTEAAAIQRQRLRLQENRASVQASIARYKEYLAESDKQIAILQEELKSGKAEARAAQTEARQAKRRVEAKKKTIERLSNDLAELQDGVRRMQNWRASLQSVDVWKEVDEGFKLAARRAARAEASVKRKIGEVGARFGIDDFDRREFYRRQAMRRAGRNPESLQKALEKYAPAEAKDAQTALEYFRALEALAEIGISGELLGHLLWTQFRATRISELTPAQVRALTDPNGPMVPLSSPVFREAAAGQIPLGPAVRGTGYGEELWRRIGAKVGLPTGGLTEVQGAVRALIKPERVNGRYVLVDNATAEQKAAFSKITDAEIDTVLTARQASVEPPPRLSDTYADAVAEGRSLDDLSQIYVQMADGNTPFGRLLRDWYVPLDLAVISRSMVGQRVSRETVGELFAVSTLQRFIAKAGQVWKTAALFGKGMGLGYGWRNRFDNVMGIAQTLSWSMVSPSFNRLYDDLVSGKLAYIDTPTGRLTREQVIEAFNQLPGGLRQRAETTVSGSTAARAAAGEESYRYAAASAELGTRGREANYLSSLSTEERKRIRDEWSSLAKKGAGMGALMGLLMGEVPDVLAGAVLGAGTGAATRLLQRGPRVTMQRSQTTAQEKVAPILEATDVFERGYREKAILLELMKGRTVDGAVERTARMWRDWTNITPEERIMFTYTVPVAFYNFAKQNTIAQFHRFMANPAFGRQLHTITRALQDSTPEDYYPEWLNPLSTFSQGGMAYALAPEVYAPFDLLADILSDRPSGILSPAGREVLALLGGKSSKVYLPDSYAAKIAKDPSMMAFIEGSDMFDLKMTEGGRVRISFTQEGYGLAGLFYTATGIKSIADYGSSLTDLWQADEKTALVWRAVFGQQAERLVSRYLRQNERGGEYDAMTKKLADAIDGLAFDPRINKAVNELRSSMSFEQQQLLDEIITASPKLKERFAGDIHRALNAMIGESKREISPSTQVYTSPR